MDVSVQAVDGDVTIPLDSVSERSLRAYYVTPEREAPFPAVVVLHEAFGLNENIRDVTRRFSGSGYAALAVDLFSSGNRVLCMTRLIYGMMIKPIRNSVVQDLQATMEFLRRQPGVNPDHVGVIGFCMGGGYALQLACVDNKMRAAAVFYGQNPRPLEAVTKACPIVGSYPGNDFTAGAARKLDKILDNTGVPHDIKIYAGAWHSFFNSKGSAYDEEAAYDAWHRTIAFFDVHLAGLKRKESLP